MPGLNKKGPQNQSPMTGGRRERCLSSTDEIPENTSFDQDRAPFGRRAGGNRRCGDRGMGRGFNNTAGSGRCRGMRRGFQ